jgi:hypothetical protein
MDSRDSSNQINWSKRFRRQEHIVSRAIIGETLLVPISGQLADMQHIFTLNPVADYVWKHLDGEISTADIRDGILSEFEVDKAEAVSDLIDFIDELLEAELIVEAA